MEFSSSAQRRRRCHASLPRAGVICQTLRLRTPSQRQAKVAMTIAGASYVNRFLSADDLDEVERHCPRVTSFPGRHELPTEHDT